MFTTNPFAELSSFIPVAAMQAYVVLMVLLVIGGTILDTIHKGSAKYFFENAKKAEKNARRTLSSSEKTALAMQTLTNEVLLSAEFKNTRRRISHLLTMYGFVIFVVMSAILIFAYPTPADGSPGFFSALWHIGALMLCFGGYWFWFFIRVDVSAEGQVWYRLTQGDIFIVSMLATATFGLIWSFFQSAGASGWSTAFFILFVISSTTLFSTVLWSKFAHMFFKPAAAYQKKVAQADGSQENLPDLPDLSNAETKNRYPDIPEYMGDNPEYMGLGIKREEPQHY